MCPGAEVLPAPDLFKGAPLCADLIVPRGTGEASADINYPIKKADYLLPDLKLESVACIIPSP